MNPKETASYLAIDVSKNTVPESPFDGGAIQSHSGRRS